MQASSNITQKKIALCIEDLGILDYQEAWDKQRLLQSNLVAGSNKEFFLFCEHPPVLSYGSSTDLSQVLRSEVNRLKSEGIQLIKSDRGGNITYHGPGQLVCYAILDLRKRHQDVSWFLRSIEGIVIDLLKSYKIESFVIPSQTGVWTSKKDKICAIGIRISRWCTMHGFALNLGRSSESGFNHIVPCGIQNSEAVSIESITGKSPPKKELIEGISALLIKAFYEDFNLNYQLESSTSKSY